MGLTHSPTGPQPITTAVASLRSASGNMSQPFLTTWQPVGKMSTISNGRIRLHQLLCNSNYRSTEPVTSLTRHQNQMPIRHPLRRLKQRRPRQRYPHILCLCSIQPRTPEQTIILTTAGEISGTVPAGTTGGREGGDDALIEGEGEGWG